MFRFFFRAATNPSTVRTVALASRVPTTLSRGMRIAQIAGKALKFGGRLASLGMDIFVPIALIQQNHALMTELAKVNEAHRLQSEDFFQVLQHQKNFVHKDDALSEAENLKKNITEKGCKHYSDAPIVGKRFDIVLSNFKIAGSKDDLLRAFPAEVAEAIISYLVVDKTVIVCNGPDGNPRVLDCEYVEIHNGLVPFSTRKRESKAFNGSLAFEEFSD